MRQKRAIDLTFPVGGVHRRSGFQKQPPYTTPSALNVRPFDVIASRLRGGSRPGLGKSHYTQLGSGNPVRLLNAVTIVQNNGLTFWVDNFDSPSMQSVWTASNISVLPDDVASVSYNNSGTAYRKAISDLDTSQPYVVELFIAPYRQEHHGNYQIFVRLDNSSPAATTDGVVCELVMPGDGSMAGSLKYYAAGVLTTSVLFTSSTTEGEGPGWFRVVVDGNDVSCFWRNTQVLAATTVGAATGSRVGFGAHCTQTGGLCLVDTFRVQYKTSNNNQAYRRLLVASSNGTLYREAYLNTFESVSSSLTLASDRDIDSSERFQKLYIADTGNPKTTGTSGVVTSGVLDKAGITWTDYSIDTDDDVCEITDVVGASGGFVAGTYKISTVHATNGLTLVDGSGGAISGGCTSCSWRVQRGAKVYDPAANTLILWMTASLADGSVPVGCPLICTYRDRMVMGGPTSAPHAWFMSKQGNPLNWNYGASPGDAGKAVAGINTESGLLGEPIKALIPGGDDYLIFGLENSITKLSGDPAYGGQINYLSREIGVVDKQAWCRGPAHEIVFLSRDGLYMMPAGGGQPVSVSRERLPNELLRLDNNIYCVQLQYDVQDRGVHIFVTSRDSSFSGTVADGEGEMRHWFLDWETKSFWPFSVPIGYEPMCSMYFSASCATDTAVLMGCRDGYVRRFIPSAYEDELTAFTSHVVYGPMKLGDDDAEGILNEIIGAIAQGSTGLTWRLRVGETAEEALQGTATEDGIWSTYFDTGGWADEGLNYKERPRARGGAFALHISGTGTWALEKVTIVTGKVGRQRRL